MFVDGCSPSRSGHLPIGKSVLIRRLLMGIEDGRAWRDERGTKKNYAEGTLRPAV